MEHKNITDPNIHPVKGEAAAAVGTALFKKEGMSEWRRVSYSTDVDDKPSIASVLSLAEGADVTVVLAKVNELITKLKSSGLMT